MRTLFRYIGIVALLSLGACALKQAPSRTEVLDQALPKTTQVPAQWQSEAEAEAEAVADNWLQLFEDPQLQAITLEAIANNLDLRQAAERVSIAQQNLIRVGSRLRPQVGAQLGARTTRDDDQGSGYDSSSAYVGVGWELDLWGRLRAQRAAAEAGYEATALDYAYARQSIAALVAKSWFLAIETRQLVELAETAVNVFSDLLELVQARQTSGKGTDLDVADVSAKLAAAKSDLEGALQSYGEARRSLEVLLGRYPGAEIAIASDYPQLPPAAPASIPTALLDRRPDVIAAERSVLEAFRREEAAELALLPSISVSLLGGRLDDQLLSIVQLNPWLATADVGVSIPVYEGGALRASVKIATAQEALAVAAYGATVLDAFREVENALANDRLLAKRIPYEEDALKNRVRAAEIASLQYQAGARDLLWVAQLQLESLETAADLARLRASQGVNRVQLYLVLGGSFDELPAADLAVLQAADGSPGSH